MAVLRRPPNLLISKIGEALPKDRPWHRAPLTFQMLRDLGASMVSTEPTDAVLDLLAPLAVANAGQKAVRAAAEPAAEAAQPLMKRLGEAVKKLYHGTPHTLPPEPGAPLGRFRNEAIGTGEGAQTYGHGHYLAETPDVGRTYKKPGMHSYKVPVTIDDIPAKDWAAANDIEKRAADALARNANADEAISYLKLDPGTEQAQKWIEKNRKRIGDDTGNLYEVALKAADEDFLLWDRPLSEQPFFRQVEEVLSEYKGSGKQPDDYAKLISLANANKNQTGGDFYHNLMSKFGGDQARTSDFLNKAGIRGIKYLDQGSRAGGQGTHNFVVFDPEDLEILRILGIAGVVFGGGAAAKGSYGSLAEERVMQ